MDIEILSHAMVDWIVAVFDEYSSQDVFIVQFSATRWFGYQVFRLLRVKEWKIDWVGLKRLRFGDPSIAAVGVGKVVYHFRVWS